MKKPLTSSTVCAAALGATCSPISCIFSANTFLSSVHSITLTCVPSTATLYLANTPRLHNSTPQFRAVCPPNANKIPSGLSLSITCVRNNNPIAHKVWSTWLSSCLLRNKYTLSFLIAISKYLSYLQVNSDFSTVKDFHYQVLLWSLSAYSTIIFFFTLFCVYIYMYSMTWYGLVYGIVRHACFVIVTCIYTCIWHCFCIGDELTFVT